MTSSPARGSTEPSIRPRDLARARTRVMRAWILVGAIGALSLAACWLITRHPEVLGKTLTSILMSPDNGSQSDRTTMDVLQLIVYFTLAWIPTLGFVVNAVLSHPMNLLEALTQMTDLTPLLYQGIVYLVLAALIWRRSMIALVAATLLFVADSGLYAYGVFRLLQAYWELNQKFQDFAHQYPRLATTNPFDLGHWPWGLVGSIVVRAGILWLLLLSFRGMATVRLHRRRVKAAKLEAQAQAA